MKNMSFNVPLMYYDMICIRYEDKNFSITSHRSLSQRMMIQWNANGCHLWNEFTGFFMWDSICSITSGFELYDAALMGLNVMWHFEFIWFENLLRLVWMDLHLRRADFRITHAWHYELMRTLQRYEHATYSHFSEFYRNTNDEHSRKRSLQNHGWCHKWIDDGFQDLES